MRIANLALCLIAGFLHYSSDILVNGASIPTAHNANRDDSSSNASQKLDAEAPSRLSNAPTLAETVEMLKAIQRDAEQRQRYEAAAQDSPLYYVPLNSPSGALAPENEYISDDDALRSAAVSQPQWAAAVDETALPAQKRAQTFVRFGKRAQTFVRFGKRAQTFVRFG